jgi:NAD(P)-dependent dehydrogenase (short-subunit alcohol dehydrogenase family)
MTAPLKESSLRMFDLHDRVVVITGGLGKLGRAYSIALSQRGARVAIVDQDCSADRKAVFGDHLASDRIIVLEGDVTSRSSLEGVLAEVTTRWEAPHVLVNNAAIDSPPDASAEDNSSFERYSERTWDDVMRVNIKGVFLCCQVFGSEMAKLNRGSIINVSSIYGMVAPDQSLYEYRRARGEAFFKPAAYSVSKSALLNLTRYLGVYWAKQRVRVNTITLAGVADNQDREFLTGYCSRIPVGRMAEPDDYIGPLTFLASDASTYMTGSNLVVDGGWTAL